MPLGSLCVIDSEPRDSLSGEQLQALETLGQAVMALLERWRIEQSSARSRNEIAELEQRFQVLADAMPQLVWSTTPDGMADYFNRRWCEFTGQPAEASYGEHWTEFLHPEDKEAAGACWANAVETGGDYEIEYRLRHHGDDYRWVLARGMPLRRADGTITRWIGTCTDIHEQKADAERLEVLSRELNHRIKNIFAVIGGLVAMTIRNKPDFTETAGELRERILALGRAHDFVRSRGGRPVLHPPGKLMGLLQTLLAPYQDAAGERIVIAGDDVAIDDRSATPLALFFHELATNAAKYGALSAGSGRVEIRIIEADGVELVWSESGGPKVRDAGERGFGTSLVEMSIVRQLGGTLDYDWRDEGLRVVARVPSDVLAR
jgi:PAS domain S-box-containing protein